MRRQVPTEREMTDMIATAFERLPAPDARRLMAIEQQLLEQPRLRGRAKIAWWWLAAALVAGTASALWWAVNYDSVEEQNQPVPRVIVPSVAPSAEPPAHPTRSESAKSNTAGEPANDRSPFIFKRER